jgi:hypothetical protein
MAATSSSFEQEEDCSVVKMLSSIRAEKRLNDFVFKERSIIVSFTVCDLIL